MIVLPNKVYCATFPHHTGKEQAQSAMRMGHVERDIFIEGAGAETFMACVAAIRGPGTIGLVHGLRVLGDSRKSIMAKLRILRERKIRPYNITTGVCDAVDLLDEAIGKINTGRATSRGPKPAVRGRQGGTMKGVRAQEYRDSVMHEGAVKRLYFSRLSIREVAEILGTPFSQTTLRRKFGPKPK